MECPILQWDELGDASKILACFSLYNSLDSRASNLLCHYVSRYLGILLLLLLVFDDDDDDDD